MKVKYRGFELEAHKEPSLGGDILLYFSIFRIEDGWEMSSGFTTGEEMIPEFIQYLREDVDDYYENPKDWEDVKE